VKRKCQWTCEKKETLGIVPTGVREEPTTSSMDMKKVVMRLLPVEAKEKEAETSERTKKEGSSIHERRKRER